MPRRAPKPAEKPVVESVETDEVAVHSTIMHALPEPDEGEAEIAEVPREAPRVTLWSNLDRIAAASTPQGAAIVENLRGHFVGLREFARHLGVPEGDTDLRDFIDTLKQGLAV